MGTVYVLTTPVAADVIWQGREMGRTPVRIRLPPGEHSLQLRPVSGGAAALLSVQIAEGEDAFASVKFD
jgi:hypothetical protein